MSGAREGRCINMVAGSATARKQATCLHCVQGVQEGREEPERYMVACPLHYMSCLGDLPRAEWPSRLPDGSGTAP